MSSIPIKFPVFGWLCLVCALCCAQQSKIQFEISNETLVSSPFQESITSYQIVSLQSAFSEGSESYELQIPIGEKKLSIQIRKNDIRANDCVIQEGDVRVENIPTTTYIGHIANQSFAGSARFSIFNGAILGCWQTEKGYQFIEAIDAANHMYIVYHEKDVVQNGNHTCANHVIPTKLKKIERAVQSSSRSGTCKSIELASAMDYLYKYQYGGLAGGINQVEALANIFEDYFQNEFVYDFEFEFVAHYAPINANPWTNYTSACELLSDFKDWSLDGGFGVNYDVAQMWTERNLDTQFCTPNWNDNVVGLAYSPSICTDYSYVVLEDSGNSNASLLSILNAHELTHTLGALNHSSSGIMTPLLSNSTDFHYTTVNEVNGHLLNGTPGYVTQPPGCLATCVVEAVGVRAYVKVYLEGAYSTFGTMSNQLWNNGLIPYSQPFNSTPYYYYGNESVSSLSSNMVDWVLIELRSQYDNDILIAEKAAMLHTDGSIYDIDGAEGVFFEDLDTDLYYIVVRHRSHLDVMSNNSVLLTNNVVHYDFTTNVNKAKGNAQLKNMGSFKYALLAGDYSGNGVINADDFNIWSSNSSAIYQYLNWDADLNGVVNVADYNYWFINRSKVGITEIQL